MPGASTGKTLLCIEAAANFGRKYPKGRIRYLEAESAFQKDYAADPFLSRSALAVIILSTVSYFTDNCTGRSAGFSLLRMRST
jgi:hypothetical protein